MTFQYIDEAALDGLRAIMGSELAELYAVYKRDSHTRLLELEALVAGAPDAAALRLAAHSLKGSSGNVGASALAELCWQLESMAMANNLEQAPQLVAKIKQLHELMLPELEILSSGASQ
ncbi:Hpt domain-containing protein [Halioxenophilus sp. WMMB6]|uniref:Hpt domain-containing protein n=1 Tax=Halioxenophilus sp. WMMB6 TaxID=3073815 RepID=UPI00295F29B9|nr:Hpt domain-containing protein [Halioxenophilus sp. WMMB6]